jgi:hypothetical protein
MASRSSRSVWMRSLVSQSLTGAMVIGVIGCGGGSTGPQRLAVSGAVTVAGQPVAEGSVKFVPSSGTTGPVAAAMIREGRYSLLAAEGPVGGRHEVVIELKPAATPAPAATSTNSGPKGGGTSNSVFYQTTAEVTAGTLDLSVDESQRLAR